MAGLVPAIHVFDSGALQDVEARHKAGHDDGVSGWHVPYKDLREFITQVDALGALRRISGADPRFELGGITEVAAGQPDCPALLFDDIRGFPRGFRIFTNATTNPQRAALALGLDPALRPLDA